MKLEVLHIADCPNWEEAGRRLLAALTATGHTGSQINYRLLTTPTDAAATSFAGSPTITIDGADLFPSDGQTNDLACRIYATPTGLAGLPTIDQITEALKVSTANARCSCCGRSLPRQKVHALHTPNAYICRRCGLWVALRPRRDQIDQPS